MTEINSVTTLTREGDVAIITLNSPPVNALSFNVRDGLYEGFKQAIADDSKAIVLICDGRTFIADATGSTSGTSAADVDRLVWRTVGTLFPDNYPATYGIRHFLGL